MQPLKPGAGDQMRNLPEDRPLPGPGLRQGPRPLPLHLTAALATWNSSQFAWPLLRSGLLPLKRMPEAGAVAGGPPQNRQAESSGSREPSAKERAEAELLEAVRNADPSAFSRALSAEVTRRSLKMLRGIEAYRHHPYSRDVADPAAIWSQGTTRLLDYATTPESARPPGPPVLVVPSLINRSYILDLASENSLLRFLAAEGFRPLLVDWGRPGEAERRFDLTDYIAGRLEAALNAATAVAGGQVPVIGYCMGGLLALALAQRRPRDVSGLVLMATPWDFHANEPGQPDHVVQGRLLARSMQSLWPACEALGEVPTDILQMLFAGLDLQLAARKFVAFADMETDSDKARAFVALEDWLNDGVPMAAPVAKECIFSWYGENAPARGAWCIAGRPVVPREVAVPSLAMLPAQDRIVPPASARALGEALPNAEIQSPPLGHIGMVVSGGARKGAWEPLRDWLSALPAA